VESDGLDVVINILCRIKITGLLPEDAEFTPVVSTSSSAPDLSKKPAGNIESRLSFSAAFESDTDTGS